MGYPILKDWVVKRSGARMRLVGTTADGHTARLIATEISRHGGMTLARLAEGQAYDTYELV